MLKCKICDKELIKNQKSTCSWRCRGEYVKKLNIGRLSPFKGRTNRWNDKQRKKIGDAQRGKSRSEAFKLNAKNYKPPTRKGIILTPEQRLKKALTVSRGENHYRWMGGITKETAKQRHSLQAKLWRSGVFARDNWTCQDCGQKGGYLEAHHIKPWSKFHELRFDINNGITWCLKCHKKNDKQRN